LNIGYNFEKEKTLSDNQLTTEERLITALELTCNDAEEALKINSISVKNDLKLLLSASVYFMALAGGGKKFVGALPDELMKVIQNTFDEKMWTVKYAILIDRTEEMILHWNECRKTYTDEELEVGGLTAVSTNIIAKYLFGEDGNIVSEKVLFDHCILGILYRRVFQIALSLMGN